MTDFHPEWLADLGPWHAVGDTPFLARCLPSDPDGAILILRPWGPWAEQRWRAVFSPPDRDDDGQDWRHGEIKAPDGGNWPDRESAEAALDAAWSAWRARYRASRGIAPDHRRRHNLLVTLTPSLLARIEALGFKVGSEGVLPWLVGKAEERTSAVADLQYEIDALRRERHAERQRVQERDAEIAEMRLTLAAEQGRAEGAPSARWTCDGRTWYGAREDGGLDKIEHFANLKGDGTVHRSRVWTHVDRFGFEKEVARFGLARSAMITSDKALETP